MLKRYASFNVLESEILPRMGNNECKEKSEKRNAGAMEHLEVISNVKSRGANFQAFLEFMETRAAHHEELGKEYTKPR
jgi:hypothetical protein